MWSTAVDVVGFDWEGRPWQKQEIFLSSGEWVSERERRKILWYTREKQEEDFFPPPFFSLSLSLCEVVCAYRIRPFSDRTISSTPLELIVVVVVVKSKKGGKVLLPFSKISLSLFRLAHCVDFWRKFSRRWWLCVYNNNNVVKISTLICGMSRNTLPTLRRTFFASCENFNYLRKILNFTTNSLCKLLFFVTPKGKKIKLTLFLFCKCSRPNGLKQCKAPRNKFYGWS